MEDWDLVLGIREEWGQERPFFLSMPERRHHLYVIQKFLTYCKEDRPFIPAKERSYQIFGDEKRLEALVHSDILFGGGKISLDLLRCYVVASIPVTERFEHGREIVILENEATFDSFCRLARHIQSYGLVVYGRGNEIFKNVSYLRRRAEEMKTKQIWYFGDVDQRGLEIPFYLGQALSPDLKLLPVMNAYAALLQETIPASQTIPVICGWLPGELASKAATVVLERRRIPQEAYGWEQIAANNSIDPTAR